MADRCSCGHIADVHDDEGCTVHRCICDAFSSVRRNHPTSRTPEPPDAA